MSKQQFDLAKIMQQAILLAKQGEGFVEPNPMVGAVLVDEQGRVIASGYHEKFGEPHAEINAIEAALRSAEKVDLKNATLFVTLEPCAHFGKTAPCADAVIAAGIRTVFIGCEDPASHTKGNGIKRLQEAGIDVEVGILRTQCEGLLRPFTKLMTTGKPYVHAKWAMTLDGKIASHSGSSQWISHDASREVVHQIRGKMDGILVGSGTVEADNPLLTTRPAGARIATRIVVDSTASLSLDSKLVQSTSQAPLIVACRENAPPQRLKKLENVGVEVIRCPEAAGDQQCVSLDYLLSELGNRKMTNLLIEGGAKILGAFFDAKQIDEVHVFIAPKIIGGKNSPSPVAGIGIALMNDALCFQEKKISVIEGDVYFNGCFKH